MNEPTESALDKIPHRDLVLPERTAWILLDLDGVILRYPQHALPDPKEQGLFFDQLLHLHEKNIGIGVITNRPSAEMQMLAYQLGQKEGVWITENGASFFDIATNTIGVFPEWERYAQEYVPAMRADLTQKLDLYPPRFNKPQFYHASDGGLVKTIIMHPSIDEVERYGRNFVEPVVVASELKELFDVKIGKAIEIDPIGLNKNKALPHLMQIGLDPKKTPVLFIGDAKRDVQIAQDMITVGGFAGAVGNSDQTLIDGINGLDRAIIAPENTQYHSSALHIISSFLSSTGL